MEQNLPNTFHMKFMEVHMKKMLQEYLGDKIVLTEINGKSMNVVRAVCANKQYNVQLTWGSLSN